LKKSEKYFGGSKNVLTFAVPLEKRAGIFTPLTETSGKLKVH
jgi:hypothetical protein